MKFLSLIGTRPNFAKEFLINRERKKRDIQKWSSAQGSITTTGCHRYSSKGFTYGSQNTSFCIHTLSLLLHIN